jgi:hypothetical protein
MSELIDRQVLIKQLKDENIPFNADINEIINIQPIAFDVANIVEKLEEIQERYDDIAFMEMNTNGHTLDFEYAHGKKDGVQEAINIVKQEIDNGLE